MMIHKITKSGMVAVIVAALAFTASVQGVETHGNPFKKGKKPKIKKAAKNRPLKQTRFSGEATALDLTNAIQGVHWAIADTGHLPATGGTISATVGGTNINNVVSFEMASASTMGGGTQASSQAQIHNFAATFGGSDGVTNTISFAFAEAIAQANCTSNGAALLGNTQIQGLVVNGVSIVVTGLNQVVAIPNGTILLNAIMESRNGRCAEITAAAIYVQLTNSFSGLIGYAKAGICCGNAAPPTVGACGKLTGGGFISLTNLVTDTNTVSARGSFSVAGGIRRGAFWGRLSYTDQGTGMQVNSTAVTGFAIVDSITHQIDYNATIDGVPGTARVIVSDHGSPGRNDTFDITLSTGYHAAGDLGGSGAGGGGNIKLHKCPPGWNR
jgi:hypothetical protein